MNVEEVLKKLIRGFRKVLKTAFDGKYKRLHYHWVDSKVQQKTFEFFQELIDAPQIANMIATNRGAFFYLIHLKFDNKKVKNSVRSEFEEMKFAPETKTCFLELFGQKPNKLNLRHFFSLQEMRYVWTQYYINTPTYQQWKKDLST